MEEILNGQATAGAGKYRFTGAKRGHCTTCGGYFGHLAAHRPACERRRAPLPTEVPLGRTEGELIVRAAAHAHPARDLPEQARAGGDVTDLDLSRLILHVERGRDLYPSPTGLTWYARGMARMPGNHSTVTRVTFEALRLGVLRSVTSSVEAGVYRTRVAAAPTHARSGQATLSPACGTYDPTVLRWRLLDRDLLACVDCTLCLSLPLSCVAISR